MHRGDPNGILAWHIMELWWDWCWSPLPATLVFLESGVLPAALVLLPELDKNTSWEPEGGVCCWTERGGSTSAKSVVIWQIYIILLYFIISKIETRKVCLRLVYKGVLASELWRPVKVLKSGRSPISEQSPLCICWQSSALKESLHVHLNTCSSSVRIHLFRCSFKEHLKVCSQHGTIPLPC